MRRVLISLGLVALVILIWPATALAATLVPLGTAGNYAVLAGSTVTNTGPSWITGELGLSAGTSVTGFPPGTVGHEDIANGAAGQAKIDLNTAFTNAAGQGPVVNVPGDLGSHTLVGGVYSSGGGLTGTLFLDGAGSTSNVWIFQMASTLVTASSSRVVLINGAQPCDVFWQVGSSATLGTSTTFVGNIMAQASITMTTGATLNGRAMAITGAVTLDTNRIIQPSGCGYAVPAYVPPPTGNILPPTLGLPLELRGSFPWLLVIGAGGALGAIALGLGAARRRRAV